MKRMIWLVVFSLFLFECIWCSGGLNVEEDYAVRQLIRRWWWSYVDVITNVISKEEFNNNLIDIWTSDGVLQEPGIFRYETIWEMLNGNDTKGLTSVVDGLLAFDIAKLNVADMYVNIEPNIENENDNESGLSGLSGISKIATVRVFKSLLYGNKQNINYNYDYWTIVKTGNEWKAKELTIYLDTYHPICDQCNGNN